MQRVFAGLLVATLATVTACTEPKSAACTAVCKREAECIDVTGNKMPFDEKECIAACAALEADRSESAAKVQRHMACVHEKQACEAVLECK
jgi:hypothetical protein